jgi:hypothetical protein
MLYRARRSLFGGLSAPTAEPRPTHTNDQVRLSARDRWEQTPGS